jgi:hypothetical protein
MYPRPFLRLRWKGETGNASRLTRLSGHQADMTVSLYVRVERIYLDVRQTSAPGTDEQQGWEGSRKYLSWTTSDDLNAVLHS